MAFTPENYEFVRVISKASGRTMTVFVNQIIEAYRAENPELMEQALGFLDTLNSGSFSKIAKEENPEG